MNSPNKIALVHDWLVTMRGGEKCFEVLCELFPQAQVFTLVHKRDALTPTIERMNITTSFLQHFPFGVSHYQWYLPLFPRAIEKMELGDVDLVISSSHAIAKAVRIPKGALHICYCHTPMRYIWDQYEQYFGRYQAGALKRSVIRAILPKLRAWDVHSSSRVHLFIANSHNVRERINRIYNRPADVIYPPVETSRFLPSTGDDKYYLIVSALVPYKRIDIAVEAFNVIGERLVIVGTGSEEQKLKRLARRNVEFLGWVDDETLAVYYQRCRALVFPAEEDFGIAPLEAMACGKPVLAFARGGALETVINGETGLFFHDQTPESIIDAVRALERHSFEPERLRAHAMKFDRSVYKERMRQYVDDAWREARSLAD